MMIKKLPEEAAAGTDNRAEETLTDADILDAMRHIPGYLDITTEDFRTIYHLAHRHALQRLFVGVTAARLMRTEVLPIHQEMTLATAARQLADSGYKSLPVVDSAGLVVGMLTENDFMKYLKVNDFVALLLQLPGGSLDLVHQFHQAIVSAAMTQPVVSISPDAGFMDIMAAFQTHAGRSMPVIDADGKMSGLLLRRDFFAAYTLNNRS